MNKQYRQPRHGSGKTRFNRNKPKGTSWVALRDTAINEGTFHMPRKST